MRKLLLFTMCALFSTMMFAQQTTKTYEGVKVDKKVASQSMKMTKQFLTGMEDLPHQLNSNLPLNNRTTEPAEAIGTTVYDLQTNGSCQNRIDDKGNGDLTATWTFGTDAAAGYPGRGTGVNTNDGSGWGPPPVARIEATVRTGWPAIAHTADDAPVTVCHISDPAVPVNALHVSRWHAGSGTWIETNIPSSSPGGMLWPRMATGGPDGNTIHVIGVTTPTGNGGQVFNGVDGHLLYFRSLDGGVTWDKTDVALPGIDMTKYAALDGDSYSIDVSGDIVAVGLWDDLGDVVVSKSTDNGETWTTHVLRDFPIDAYAADQGWTNDQLSFQDTVGGPEGTSGLRAIMTSDGTGDVLIDNNGTVHAWYGEMFYLDEDLTDGNFSFFPLWSGVRYWNESYGEDSTNVVAGLVDADGNGTYDLQSTATGVAANYFTGITGFISAAVDVNNSLYIAYAALTEDNWKEDANPELQHYRHVFLTASEDGGATWLEDPVDIIVPGLVDDDDLIPAMEATFPSVARNVTGDFLNITYQLDFEPGLSVRGDTDPAETNFIYHIAVDVEEIFGISNTEVVVPETFEMNLAPNPANGNVNLSYKLTDNVQTTISIVNMVGQEVKRFENGVQFAGEFTQNLDISGLAKGVYLVRFQADNQSATQRLVVN